MAVLTVKEIWEGREGSADSKAHREYTRVFQVVTDSTLDDAITVGKSVEIVCPMWSAYVGPSGTVDLLSGVGKITPRQQTESPYVWNVLVNYTSRIGDPSRGGGSGFSAPEAPQLRAPVYRWSTQKFRKPVDQDILGNPITTSAGEAYDPKPEIDDSRLILTVTRNELMFDPGVAQLYTNATNSDPFFGAVLGQVKCDSIEGTLKFESGLWYWEVTYTFHFRTGTDNWTLQLLDEGSYYLDGSTPPKAIKFTDRFSGKVRGLLDGNGGQLIGPPKALNDTQTVTMTGSPTGGTITLSGGPLSGTVGLSWNDTAAIVQSKFNAALPPGGTCICTGGPFPGQPVIIKFTGNLAGLAQTVMTVSVNSLTGGTSPNASVAHTIVGAPAVPAVYNSYVVYRILPFGPLQIAPDR